MGYFPFLIGFSKLRLSLMSRQKIEMIQNVRSDKALTFKYLIALKVMAIINSYVPRLF